MGQRARQLQISIGMLGVRELDKAPKFYEKSPASP